MPAAEDPLQPDSIHVHVGVGSKPLSRQAAWPRRTAAGGTGRALPGRAGSCSQAQHRCAALRTVQEPVQEPSRARSSFSSGQKRCGSQLDTHSVSGQHVSQIYDAFITGTPSLQCDTVLRTYL